MEVKRGQIWKHPFGYLLKVVNYDDTSGKWLLEIPGEYYYCYVSAQRILEWELWK